jgi:hypothetical protein
MNCALLSAICLVARGESATRKDDAIFENFSEKNPCKNARALHVAKLPEAALPGQRAATASIYIACFRVLTLAFFV